MKKALITLLATVGLVSVSHAVVIHWAVSTPVDNTTEAALVYVASGVPTAVDGSTLAAGDVVITTAGNTAFGVNEQATYDTSRDGGAYYVVLFNNGNLLAYSTTGLASSDGTYITFSEMAPATGVFDPGAWSEIPEPCSLSLLCVGAATLAIRRRRKRLS